MTSAKNRYRKDIGVQQSPVSILLVDVAVDDTPVAVVSSTAGYISVIDRIYFRYPTDVVAWDITIAVQGIGEVAATPRTILLIDEGGTAGVIDPRQAFTYDVGNPPTGFVHGYMDLINTALGVSGDSVTVSGNDATDANNYDSTGAVSAQISFHYRLIDSSVW